MRRTLLSVSVLTFPILQGCALSDVVFHALGSKNYTASGLTCSERKSHFDHQVQQWNDHDKYGTYQHPDERPWDSASD